MTSLQKNSGFLSVTLLIVAILACTLGALIIPISNDYTLPILMAPIAVFFCTLPGINEFKNRPLAILLLLIISISYSSILYPFKYKPYFLNNSFPPLFLILVAVTLLYFLSQNRVENPDLQQENSGFIRPAASSVGI